MSLIKKYYCASEIPLPLEFLLTFLRVGMELHILDLGSINLKTTRKETPEFCSAQFSIKICLETPNHLLTGFCLSSVTHRANKPVAIVDKNT